MTAATTNAAPTMRVPASGAAVSGTPTVLVPFPQAADRHQDANAVCAAAGAAAVIVHQHAPDHAALGNCIRRLLGGRLGDADARPELLEQMRAGMDELAKRDADAQLARLLTTLLH